MIYDIAAFVEESNRIERIDREPTHLEIEAHINFLAQRVIAIPDLEQFVNCVQPGARLREKVGWNVRVGDHYPPPGGPHIREVLIEMLERANAWRGGERHAYDIHQHYEDLHPFMDGNGRSGRVLWLWMMGGIPKAPLGFLHTWYYQSLQGGRR